ncbi:MAG: diadenylate cyclase CdaA [Myxococcales bacterium]|nr:diadenylate cyclase CdaA [Myxococcales bacterium]
MASIFGGIKLGDWPWVILDILIVYYLIYRTLLLLKGTRALQMLVGLTLIIIGFFASKEDYLNLTTLNWILDKFISAFIIIIIVIFQEDIRRALSKVGANPFLAGGSSKSGVGYMEEIVRACAALTQKGLGAIMVIERQADLSQYAEEAFQLDAAVNRDLLFSIFLPSYSNPLHDGAVLVRNGRISNAGVFLPLSVNPSLEKALGTRHRAGIGITEVTDALSVIVSEETRTISLAMNGEIKRGLDANSLRAELQAIYRIAAEGQEPPERDDHTLDRTEQTIT